MTVLIFMSNSARAYIAAVIILGGAIAAFALSHWRSDDLMRFVVFLILFAAAATLKFRVPGVRGTYTSVFFFALLGSATLSFSEVAIASALAGSIQCAFKPKHRVTLHQIAFNAANLIVSTSCGFLFVRGLIPGLGGQPLPASLILGSAVFYCVNTALVSGVLTLIEGDSFWQTWKHWCLASLPYFVAGALIVWALLKSDDPIATLVVIVVAPPLLLASIYFRGWLPAGVIAELNKRDMSYVA